MNSKEETVRPMKDPAMEWVKLESSNLDLISSKQELEDRYFNFLLEEFLKGGYLYIEKYKGNIDNLYNKCHIKNEAFEAAEERMKIYLREQLIFLFNRKEELESRIKFQLKHLL